MSQNFKVPDLRYIEAVIVGVLLSHPAREMYGLEILDGSGGLLKRGSIYVTLQRMEEKKLLESRQESRAKPEVGIARRVYSVTGLGERAFDEYRVKHQKLSAIISPV